MTRLEAAGLVRSERAGRQRLVAPNPDSPFYPELASLLLKAFGPVVVFEQLLSEIAGIQEAHVFGSWARRYLGEPGPPPADLDLLVVGDVDVDEVYDVLRKAEAILGRDVNPTILSSQEWAKPTTAFVCQLRDGARAPVVIRAHGS